MTVTSLNSLPRGRRLSAVGAVGALVALALFGIDSTIIDVSSSPPSSSTLWGKVRAEQGASLTPAAKQQLNAYGRVPLSFEKNEGQTDARVAFLSRGIGYTLFLSDGGEAVLALSGTNRASADHRPGDLARGASDPINAQHRKTSATGTPDLDQGAALRLKIVNANEASRGQGRETLPGKVNYIRGQDRAAWRTGVSTFARVAYDDVYPGVDLVYYGNQRQLEYDFIVRPGADPRVITLEAEGADRLEIDDTGDLVMHVGNREVRQHKPVVYQEVGGVRHDVEGRYQLQNARRVQFQLAEYDLSLPVVIDPVLVYSTFLGGCCGSSEQAAGIAVDGTGNAYVTGRTSSADFPTTMGVFDTSRNDSAASSTDAIVTKLDATGTSLVYSTFLGGVGDDNGFAIAVDAAGYAYVTGGTNSSGFPSTVGAFDTNWNGSNDVFVAKLNTAGTALVYSTFLGGSGGDVGYGVAVDAAGNAYVAGATASANFPTTVGAFDTSWNSGGADVFVTKLSADGTTLAYSTFLGASPLSFEIGTAIAVDGAGHAYVTGNANEFPTTVGAFDVTANHSIGSGSTDAFVAKLDVAGTTLVYSTLLGGAGHDWAYGIAVDATNNAYVTGYTDSVNFPTTVGAFDTTPNGKDIFVTKLDAYGATLAYSTVLGGASSDEEGRGIVVDAEGRAYVTGYTGSADFPTTASGFDLTLSGIDAFLATFDASGGALMFSTFVGGTGGELGLGNAVDVHDDVYVSGYTFSANFPTTLGAIDTSYNGSGDAFVAKISIPVADAPPTAHAGADFSVNEGQSGVMLDGTGSTDPDSDTLSYAWTQVSGTTVVLSGASTAQPTFTAPPVGVAGVALTFSLKVTANGKESTDTVTVMVVNLNRPPVAAAGADQAVDENGAVGLTAADSVDPDGDPLTYAWTQVGGPTVTLAAAGTATPTFTAPLVGLAGTDLIFEVTVSDGYGGTATDAVVVHVSNVDVLPTAEAGANFSVNEGQVGVALQGSGSDADGDALTYAWEQVVDGSPLVALAGASTTTPTFSAPVVAVGGETLTFTLTVTANGESATDSVSVTVVNVNHTPVAEAGPDQAIAEGSPVTLAGGNSFDIDTDTFTYSWVQVSGPTVTLAGANTATPTFTAPYAGSGGGAGVVATLVFRLTVADGYAPDAPAPGYELSDVEDTVAVEITNTNNAPTAAAGADQTVDENAAVALSAGGSTDPDSDPLTYAWVQVGGPPVVLAGAGTAAPSFTAPFVSPGGIDVAFRVTANDGYGGTAADTVVVHVQNINDPPLASAARPTIATLWPPNHQMVPVGITGVTDPNNNATITITGVTQDEPTNGLGDGDTAVDAVINPNGTVLLRSERSGTGDGRVYRISFTASDPEGSTTGVVFVTVPHSPKKLAIDSGVVVDSTQ